MMWIKEIPAFPMIMRAYVEKYFLINSIVESEIHRIDGTTDGGTHQDDISRLPMELIETEQ